MDWTGWADWLCYGQWEKVGFLGGKIQWRFDKERIRHELATNLFRVRFCPHLRTDLSEAVLRHLPDTVNPESDRRFGYHRTYEEVPGAIKVVEKERGAGMEFSNEYWADGLQPTGFHAFVDILTKALHDIGADPKAALALSDLKWNG